MKLSECLPNPRNPRHISTEQLAMLKKSMDEFGDLSGLVHNVRDNTWVGGHQRNKNIPQDCEIIIRQEYNPPTRTGTVAEGYIVIAGEKWNYRAVDWDYNRAQAAMVSANKQGGEWDYPILTDVISDLDSHNIDMELLGYQEKELEKLMTHTSKPEPEPEEDDEKMRHASDNVRIVQLTFDEATHLEFLNKLEFILSKQSIKNISDVLMTLIRKEHALLLD